MELIYSRLSHPNAEILEDQIVPVEPGAAAAAVFNSGMAAISTVFFTLGGPNSSFVYTTPVYGGTQHLIHQVLEPLGMQGIPVPAGDAEALNRAAAEASRLHVIFVETPANPTMRMTDIQCASAAAHRHPDRPALVVDNTLLGPCFQHPLRLGANLVVYSGTKYLNGFSDLLAGVALARDPELISRLRGARALFGNILQPDECWLLNGRLTTVSLRMNRQSKNAQRIAEKLAGHPKVNRVLYPSLFDEPGQIAIRDRQCTYPGAIFSLDLKGGKPAAFEFLRRLKIAHNAVSLGGVETLVCHPKTTTHSEMSEQELLACGVTDSLVRVSVGIEDWRDLLREFEEALEAI